MASSCAAGFCRQGFRLETIIRTLTFMEQQVYRVWTNRIWRFSITRTVWSSVRTIWIIASGRYDLVLRPNFLIFADSSTGLRFTLSPLDSFKTIWGLDECLSLARSEANLNVVVVLRVPLHAIHMNCECRFRIRVVARSKKPGFKFYH